MTLRPGYTRSPLLLSRESARLLVIDIQEKLVPAIHNSEGIVEACSSLIHAAGILQVPVWATEQYPKGLGSTVPELAALIPPCTEKLRFSAAEVLDWEPEHSDGNTRHQVVVVGIEAHVCVLQTAMDLLAQGFEVHIPIDAVGSRFDADRTTAIQRMRDAGATVSTTETVIFELCETAAADEFKQISQLIRSRRS